MARCRIVTPEIVRLPVSDGDFLDVRKELNAGEYVALLDALYERQRFAKILAYVVGWSFVGLDGSPLPWDPDGPAQARRDVVGALDTATLRELVATLDRHEATQDADREKKRTPPPGAPALKTTTTSLDVPAGPSTTSAG
jgi:hypothetical protein